MTVRAAVVLGGAGSRRTSLVQAVVGRVDDADELRDAVTVPMKPWRVGARATTADRFEAAVPLPHAGLLGYTVRVLPRHHLLAVARGAGPKVVLAG